MKRAFTLIEITLAMLIMAGGVLSIVGLFSYGYREASQSREDVASAALAKAVISPLVMAISATNLCWSKFGSQERSYPSGNMGWGSYIDRNKGVVTQDPKAMGRAAYEAAMSTYSSCVVEGGDAQRFSFPDAALSASGLTFGLVIQQDSNSAVVRIGFRAGRKKSQLMSWPLYYTEVRFQGVVD